MINICHVNKNISIESFNFSIPNDATIQSYYYDDWSFYNINYKEITILHVFIGNYPNTKLMEKKETIRSVHLDSYSDVSSAVWSCGENFFCTQLEVYFPNISYPSALQLSYKNLSAENSKLADNIIKTLKGPERVLNRVIQETDEKSLSVDLCSGFSLDLPPFSKLIDIYFDKNRNINGKKYKQIEVVSKKNLISDPIIIEVSDKSTYPTDEEINQIKELNLAILRDSPFLYELNKRSLEYKSLFLDSTTSKKPDYSILIEIPFEEHGKKTLLKLNSVFDDKSDAMYILKLINSIKKDSSELGRSCFDEN